MKKWEKFSDEELAIFVKESYSFHQLAEKCGYQKNGGSGITAVKEMCQEKSFDVSHFSTELRKEDIDIEKIFIPEYKSRETLKRNLIILRGHYCECCGLSKWNEKEIPLQVHHIDGDSFNNTLDNLQLLCPNCHAQTDTYCGRNKKIKHISDEQFIEALNNSENIHQAILKLGSTDGRLYERARKLLLRNDVNLKEKNTCKNYCQKCGKEISKRASYCTDCYALMNRVTERPLREELKTLIRNFPFTEIGKMFNVSDNTIRKWCDAEKLPRKKTEINKYTNEEWEKI